MEKRKVRIPMYSFYSFFGGSEKQAEKLSSALIKSGVDVSIITTKATPNTRNIPKEIKIELLPYLYKGQNPLLRKISSFIFLLELFLFLLWSHKEYDVLQTFFIDKYALVTCLCGLITKKPVIMLEANLKKYENPGVNLKNDLLHQTLYKIYKKAAVFVAISDEIREEFEETFEIPESIIRSIPNGVELIPFEEKETARNKLNLPLNKHIGLIVGRLTYQKNHLQLFKAWKSVKEKNPDAILICLGEGEKRNELEQFIAENGCENNILLPGTKNNVHDYLNAADIFFLPSHFEGMPNALIEAMSAGSACIASKIKAHTPLLQDNYSGVLFDLSISDEELSNIIINLFNNPELRSTLGENAGKKAQEYSIDKIAVRYVDLYNKLT